MVIILNKNSTLITHNILYNKFSAYGQVLRILIFEKSLTWKAFVEMDSLQSAEKAKNHLNNDILLDDGSPMNVYYSNIQQLNFQNNNPGGIDYTLLKQQQQKKSNIKPWKLFTNSTEQLSQQIDKMTISCPLSLYSPFQASGEN